MVTSTPSLSPTPTSADSLPTRPQAYTCGACISRFGRHRRRCLLVRPTSQISVKTFAISGRLSAMQLTRSRRAGDPLSTESHEARGGGLALWLFYWLSFSVVDLLPSARRARAGRPLRSTTHAKSDQGWARVGMEVGSEGKEGKRTIEVDACAPGRCIQPISPLTPSLAYVRTYEQREASQG